MEQNISKKDIQIWIKKLVQEEAKKIIDKAHSKSNLNDLTKSLILENNIYFNSKNKTVKLLWEN